MEQHYTDYKGRPFPGTFEVKSDYIELGNITVRVDTLEKLLKLPIRNLVLTRYLRMAGWDAKDAMRYTMAVTRYERA